MLKNNIELDVKVRCIENGITQAQLAQMTGITPSYVNRLIRKNENIVSRVYLKMLEALGYDVQLVYIRKENGEQNR